MKTVRRTLIAGAKRLNPEELNRIIKEEDFFYSIIPLRMLLEKKMREIFSEICADHIFQDQERLILKLSDRTNLCVINRFFGYTLVHEMNVARLAGVVSIKDDRTELKDYLLLTSHPEWIDYLFDKYKLMEERLCCMLTNLLSHTRKILSRLSEDYDLLVRHFGLSNKKITHIELFLGDFHNNAQSVCKISFSKEVIFYKPRNQANEAELLQVIKFLNERGCNLDTHVPDFIDRIDYSWVRMVTNRPAETPADVQKYFYSRGQDLCLFYLLGSRDIINDNIICDGHTPYYIDLECLVNKPLPITDVSESIRVFSESVMQTGILPVWGLGDNYQRNILIGSLHNLSLQKAVLASWQKVGTSDIALVREERSLSEEKAEKHLPVLNGKRIEINAENLPYLINGFQDLYHFLSSNRHAVKSFIKSNQLFAHSFTRIILHHTSLYTSISENLAFPEAFQDKKVLNNIKGILNDTAVIYKSKKVNRKIVQSILDQFQQADIPYFYSYSDSTALYEGNGAVVDPTFFPARTSDSQNQIFQRMHNLSDSDLTFQKDAIIGSINFYLDHMRKKLYEPQKKYSDLIIHQKGETTDLLEAARKVADDLIQKSFTIKGEINWLAKTRSTLDGNYEFMPLHYELYEGLGGIAYFLLYLSKFSGAPIYYEIAENILSRGKDLFRSYIRNGYYNRLLPKQRTLAGVSPYTFPLSHLFLMEHFTSINPGSFDSIFLNESLAWCREFLPENKNFDYLMGSVGAIDLLLTLNTKYPEACIEPLLRQTINDFVGHRVELNQKGAAWPFEDAYAPDLGIQFLGGFAHGTGGIAYVLFRAAKELNKPEWSSIAQQALQYDRSLYRKEIRGWKDAREPDKISDNSSWCHGSAGIGLSRALITQYYHDDQLKEEIATAVQNVLRDGPNDINCLCHGNFGNIEVATTCATLLGDAELLTSSQKLIKKLIEELKSGFQWRSGDEMKQQMVGLFLGVAGLGYTLLRLHDPHRMPSILSLESSTLNHPVMRFDRFQ